MGSVGGIGKASFDSHMRNVFVGSRYGMKSAARLIWKAKVILPIMEANFSSRAYLPETELESLAANYQDILSFKRIGAQTGISSVLRIHFLIPRLQRSSPFSPA